MLYGNNHGYLHEKLRNKARKQAQSTDANENGSEDPEEEINSDELMQYFKNYVVADLSIDDFKSKMEVSVNYRRQILVNPPEPIHRLFGFYFVDPRLVNMFFSIVGYFI